MDTNSLITEDAEQQKTSGPVNSSDNPSFLKQLAILAPETLMSVAAGTLIAMVVISGVQPGTFSPSEGKALPPSMGAALSGGNSTNQSDQLKSDDTAMKGTPGDLSEADLEMARIAWKYFENNYNPETGLVNSVNNYPSTTMWDTGSALAAYITAKDLQLIGQKQFDDAMMALLETLSTIELFDGAAPNKVYNTQTRQMVDYGNNDVPDGIGVSVLDLARLVSWMATLQNMHPKYSTGVNSVLSRWDYSRLVYNEEMYGMERDADDRSTIHPRQEGRLGYEQYAAKVFEKVGFSTKTAANYNNKWRSNTDVLGVSIAYDSRDPRKYTANNYVVTESYAMDAMEHGIDDDNRQLLQNIYDVQKKRWQDTGIVTAISEDNIDREPYFLYNTIYNAGLNFSTIDSSGNDFGHLKSVSTKAAISMAMLFPDDPYSDILMANISSAYDPDGGWYAGVYESGAGYNDVTTANTNGVILGGILYKKYGPILQHCNDCAMKMQIKPDPTDTAEQTAECNQCETPRKLSLSDE